MHGVVVGRTLRVVQSESDFVGAETSTSSISAAETKIDDLSRQVYGVLGIPVDAIEFSTLLQSMAVAVDDPVPFLISTPNVNFLIKSQHNREFRESMLLSNLCLADGMPLIWIAKLLRIPMYERIAGADLFGRLKSTNGEIRPMKVFLLGGAEGTGAIVCEKLNSEECGLQCVGVLNPGFGTIEEMSTAQIIETINSSNADLLAVFFGAEKAQAWLMHNHQKLRIPLRAQFGATINFEAGTVKRAPHFLRSTGFEWLWRIKEEPYLWRRYWNDGAKLLWLLLTSVLPLSVYARRSAQNNELIVEERSEPGHFTIALSGDATAAHVDKAILVFRRALALNKKILIDVSDVCSIDPRFFGLFLMVRKHLAQQGLKLIFVGATPSISKVFRLNRFDYLLSDRF